MKKLIISIFLLIAIIPSLTLYAEEEEENTVTGEIIEMVPQDNLIQVRDRNYIVEMVLVDAIVGDEPVMGSFYDLSVGSIVKVYVGEKGQDFWSTEKVIVYEGEKKEEILKDMD